MPERRQQKEAGRREDTNGDAQSNADSQKKKSNCIFGGYREK